jgi:hypothetical protein
VCPTFDVKIGNVFRLSNNINIDRSASASIKQAYALFITASGVGKQVSIMLDKGPKGHILRYALPARETFAIATVSTSFVTPNYHALSDELASINITKAVLIKNYNYYTDPGESHLFGRLDQHSEYRLGKEKSELRIQVPTINDENVNTLFLFTLVVTEYTLVPKVREADYLLGND